jgi:hypothetical protein
MDLPSQIEIFNTKLKEIQQSHVDITKISQEAILLCRNELGSLKMFVKLKGFNSTHDEIQFFRKIKPIPASALIYYLKIYAFESRLSKTAIQFKQKFIDKAKNKSYQFLENYLDFDNYLEQGQTHLDVSYFTRNQSVQIMMIHTDDYFYDLSFNTSHDMLLAKINGHKRFIDYLESRLNKRLDQSGNSTLKWTSSKVALTELIYALYHAGVVNNGNLDIKELALELQKIFNIELGDFYKIYSDIRLRKYSRTKFLDELSLRLIDEIDHQDS